MSANSLLPPGFARLARTPGRGRVESGSPATLLIEWASDIRDIQKIPAIEALAHRWMPKLHAMQAIDTMGIDRKAYVYVPKVESIDGLIQELAKAGVKATLLPSAGDDVRGIRETLALTQEQFAVRFGLDVEAVRKWESGQSTPDATAQSYLRAIHGNPQAVEAALWSNAAQSDTGGTRPGTAEAEGRRARSDATKDRVTPSAA